MVGFIEWLGNAFVFYRASHDAGMWLWQLHSKQVSEYMEALSTSKGMM